MGAEWFAGRLRELRERAGLTQKDLADRAGVSKATVADLEQGRYAPSWPTVVALAEALRVECTAFLQQPQAGVEVKPGRPRKATAEGIDTEPKRPRGRPRKAPAATQETPAASKATAAPSGQQKPATGRGGKRKGKE
jgi:DNA-binding XRE family transcriptional regulator